MSKKVKCYTSVVSFLTGAISHSYASKLFNYTKEEGMPVLKNDDIEAVYFLEEPPLFLLGGKPIEMGGYLSSAAYKLVTNLPYGKFDTTIMEGNSFVNPVSRAYQHMLAIGEAAKDNQHWANARSEEAKYITRYDDHAVLHHEGIELIFDNKDVSIIIT